MSERGEDNSKRHYRDRWSIEGKSEREAEEKIEIRGDKKVVRVGERKREGDGKGERGRER